MNHLKTFALLAALTAIFMGIGFMIGRVPGMLIALVVGSMVGGGMLNLSGMNYHFTALGGVPLAVIAVALLTIYSMRHETHTDALERMREITV